MSVLLQSRVAHEPDEIEPGYSESALAEELARIMKRKPVRAVHDQAEEARSPAAADATAGKGIEPSEPSGRVRAAGPRSEPDTEPVSGPPAALPAWATGRKKRAGAHRARMVGASLLAMTVVLAIIGGTAVAMFGNRADVAALSRDVLGKLTWEFWSSPTTARGGKNGEAPRGMAAAERPAVR